MTIPLSTKEHIGLTAPPDRRFRKKAYSVSGKIIVVIHQDLVERLGINEETWIDQEETNGAISLTISNLSEQVNSMMEANSNESNHKEK
jgi:hypothetical protein